MLWELCNLEGSGIYLVIQRDSCLVSASGITRKRRYPGYQVHALTSGLSNFLHWLLVYKLSMRIEYAHLRFKYALSIRKYPHEAQ